jgi:hypothetical protein
MSASRHAEYRKQAEYCREQGARAVRKSEKSEWLKMAVDWERMAAETESAEKPFAQKEKPGHG